MSMFKKTCDINENASAPNPVVWSLLSRLDYNNATVLKVRYPNCTNFEGIKILVFKGRLPEELPAVLDPHFSEHEGPFARFSPTHEGWVVANNLAKFL